MVFLVFFFLARETLTPRYHRFPFIALRLLHYRVRQLVRVETNCVYFVSHRGCQEALRKSYILFQNIENMDSVQNITSLQVQLQLGPCSGDLWCREPNTFARGSRDFR